jgi:CHASE3 domain sensor protein
MVRDARAAGFAFLFAAAVAVGYLAYRTTEADQWVAHTLNVQKIARDLLGQIQEAETGQRSFLLTGDGSYLEPYTVALVTAPTTLRNLRALTSDNHEQQDRLAELTPLIERRLRVAKRTVDLSLSGRRDEAIEIVKNGEGKSLMGAIHVILNDFIDAESLLLTQRSDRSAALRATLFSLIGLCMLIVCVLAAMVASSSRRYIKSLRDEARRREAAEGSLRQAQKMEAVGQLTGGIAHDFNNLLTIILGNLEIAGRRLAKAEPAMRDFAGTIEQHVGHAVEGGRRAAQLTHRLLAFSRQQPLEPKVTDLNRLVAGMGELLRRSVGEAIEI